MSTINLRVGNDALTFAELDANFTNLNNDKYEINDSPQFTAVGIGTAASSIALDISATNAIRIPVGTDGQRPTAATGMIRYNTTSSSFEGYSGTAWASLGGVKDVDGDTTILAESSAGADEDVLTFITGGSNTATLSASQFDVEVNFDVTGTITASSTVTGSNLSGTNTGDEPAASATVAGIVELATVSEVNAGTDTTRAVTPAGVAGFTGSANVVTVGTISTGTWNGSVIAEAYLQNQSGTNTGDEPDASATVKGIVELATVSEVNAGTDTVRAVTPAGVAGFTGSANIVTVGTISTGTWQGTAIDDAYISSATTWNGKQDALTFGIADTNSVVINSATVADNDYAKFTASGLEGRSTSEVKNDLSLNNVENTALSTWAGSTNITTLGTIATGTWNGSIIAEAYLQNQSGTNTGDEPDASATVAGIVTTGTQTFAGAKTFNSTIAATEIRATTNVTVTAPAADDVRINGYGLNGNRAAAPVYLQNGGAGGIALGCNASIGSGIVMTVNTGSVDITGTLTATSKSFDIEHPTREGKRLRYGSLEGPENGVYVRGKLSSNKVIELPDYWTGLVDENTITVSLTPIGSNVILWVQKVEDNKVYIEAIPSIFECYYHVFAERKDIDKITVEYDA